MTPDQYCESRAAQSGSSFYYSFRLLPPERRRAITALYAFCREVDDVVDEVHDPAVARAKLAWWRNEIGAVAAFRLVDVVPALPKTRSGKILRKTLRGIAAGRDEPVPSTIEDASVLDALRPILRDG